MGLLVVSGALIACDCGTRTSSLIVAPMSLSLDLPTMEITFDYSLPQINLDLDSGFALDLHPDLNLDLNLGLNPLSGLGMGFDMTMGMGLDLDLGVNMGLSLTLLPISLSVSLNLPRVSLGLSPEFKFDLDLSAYLTLPTLNVDLSLPAFDPHLNVDMDFAFPMPDLDASLNFSFDANLSGALASGKPVATIGANIPHVNFQPFGMCKSSGNPEVAASGGKPSNCTPKTGNSWSSDSKVSMGGSLALDKSSTLGCDYGCVIRILDPGQSKVTVAS